TAKYSETRTYRILSLVQRAASQMLSPTTPPVMAVACGDGSDLRSTGRRDAATTLVSLHASGSFVESIHTSPPRSGHANARLSAVARSRDGGVRQELAVGVRHF